MGRPKVNSKAQQELDKAEEQFDRFSQEVKELSSAPGMELPVEEDEKQTKASRKEIRNANDTYLKPKRTIYSAPNPKTGKPEVFNERYREEYERKKKYVKFIAENKEIIGETICLWTKPFSGIPAEEWEVPVNKVLWAPQYLYDKIKKCRYTRLMMEDRPTVAGEGMTYYGQMVAKSKIQRLDVYKADDDIQVSICGSNF